MCGLFGVVRAAGHPASVLASEVVVGLGHLAQARGTDASGLAMVGRFPGPVVTPRQAQLRRVADLGGVRVRKATAPFAAFWKESWRSEVDRATIVVGHTRWASQGARDLLANSSPLAVGPLVGTHNGDVAKLSIPAEQGRGPVGGTDSEVLYLALARCRGSAEVARLLATVQGRVALAWVDRRRPNRLYLARGATSPLVIARDREDNLYWCSDAGWLATAGDYFGAGFGAVREVPEGRYMSIRVTGRPVAVVHARFIPRRRPARLPDQCQDRALASRPRWTWLEDGSLAS